MDEPLVRLAFVAGVAILVGAIWAIRGSRVPGRSIPATGLGPGIYLFSSTTCAECDNARERLGAGRYVDIAWEVEPDVFDRLGIGEVPSTLVVSNNGSGTWYRGVPERIVKRHNP